MTNKNNKTAIVIAGVFELILIYTAILNVISRQWKDLAQVCLGIICITIPFVLAWLTNKKKIVLPSSFELISVLFIIFLLYFGEMKKFYEMFWWWDLFLHGTFGIYAAVIGMYLALGVFVWKRDVSKRRYIILITIFAFCFSLALGALWEVFEFLGDFFFKTNMLDGGIEDTMSDLIVKTIGAFISSIICCYGKMRS